jgi:hypothetical protein
VDRLIALLGLRVKLELRTLVGRRERLASLLLVLPFLLFGTAVVSAGAYFGVRALDRAEPGLVLPALSAAVTGVGVLWALAPLLSGIALAETHDLTRLLTFPVPFRTLLASSLLANLLEPASLAKLPVVLAACVALAGPLWGRPFVFLLGLLAFVFMLAATQTVGLVLHALSRNRRFHDRALVLGIGLGFLMSLLPFLFLYGGRSFREAAKTILVRDVFALSPWAWPVRGAVHASRGEVGPTIFFGLLGLLTLAAVLALNAVVARRLYEGDLELGPARGDRVGKHWLRFPGCWGALFEKDLRLYWRDPRLKGMLFTSVLSPILLLLLWRGAAGRPASGFLVFLAAFSGLGALGGNAFALERRGVLLLFSFPVDRFEMLVGKNLAAMALRVPSLLALLGVAALLAEPGHLLPLLATAFITLVLGAATDNFLSILYPVPVPEPGRNPNAPLSGGRGLAAGLVTAALMSATLAVAAPFMFLAFLPVLLGDRRLLLVAVPLALAGALGLYLVLAKLTAGFLSRREPELLARVLAEE